jgi:hypothetical protein
MPFSYNFKTTNYLPQKKSTSYLLTVHKVQPSTVHRRIVVHKPNHFLHHPEYGPSASRIDFHFVVYTRQRQLAAYEFVLIHTKDPSICIAACTVNHTKTGGTSAELSISEASKILLTTIVASTFFWIYKFFYILYKSNLRILRQDFCRITHVVAENTNVWPGACALGNFCSLQVSINSK